MKRGLTTEATDESLSKIKWYTIERDMITAKGALLFLGADRSSTMPFIGLYLKSIGLAIEQVGYVIAAGFLGKMLGNIFWPVVADKTRFHRIILTVLALGAFAFRISSVFLAASIGDDERNRCPLVNATTVANVTSSITTSNESTSVNKLTLAMGFWFFLHDSFNSPIFSFLEAGIIAKIKATGERHDYGRQFLFAAIGFGTAPLIAGKFMDIQPMIKVSCYFMIFAVSSVFLCCCWACTQLLYRGIEVPRSEDEKSAPIENYRKDLLATLRQTHVIMFLLTLFVNGIMYSIYINYIFIYLRELRAPNLLLALTIASGSLSGIVVFFFTSNLIRLFRGTFNSMVVGLMVWTIRCVIFGVLRNPWIILPCQLALHGISLSFFFSLKTVHMKQIVKPSIHTTMFGIGGFIVNGFASLCGSLAGGRMYAVYGARHLFFILAGMTFSWGAVLIGYLTVAKPQIGAIAETQEAVPLTNVVKDSDK